MAYEVYSMEHVGGEFYAVPKVYDVYVTEKEAEDMRYMLNKDSARNNPNLKERKRFYVRKQDNS